MSESMACVNACVCVYCVWTWSWTIRGALNSKMGVLIVGHLGYEYMWKPRAQTDSSMRLLNWPSVFHFVVRIAAAYVFAHSFCLHSTLVNGIFILEFKQNLYKGLSIEICFIKRILFNMNRSFFRAANFFPSFHCRFLINSPPISLWWVLILAVACGYAKCECIFQRNK